jgi:flagellar biogenesis protein FliO
MNTTPLFDFFLACPMCMSGVSGQGLMAANTAIGVMLVILFAVLASFFAFIIYLVKRSGRVAAEDAAGEQAP